MIPCLQTLVLSLLLFLSIQHVKADPTVAVPPAMARPGCPDRCGNISIPFPFGIGVGCFIDPWFEINCNSNKPFLPRLRNSQVMDITLSDFSDRQIDSLTVGMPVLYSCGANHTKRPSIDLRNTPFNFAADYNVFLMEGCSGSAFLYDQTSSDDQPFTGCITTCHGDRRDNLTNKGCRGEDGCCQMQLPIGFYGQSSDECIAATLIKNGSVDQYIGKLLPTSNQSPSIVPVLLFWGLMSNLSPDHNPNADCWYQRNSINCRCSGNSAGNPYLLNGCQRQAACKHCRYCKWKEENYSYYCETTDDFANVSLILIAIGPAVGLSISPVILVFGCRWLFYAIKRRRKIERRVKIFKLELQKYRSPNEGDFLERTKLFTQKTLDKATDHFNENRILGKGGQGTVYKGMLTDGKIVAIKKASKLEDESQMEQLINEVVILSTINHRNVVKLLGCCLQTEVPLLVYEFISNGTLFQHIHSLSEDFVLTWAMRLKIATDAAGAIAYLHSSSSTPIYHRDIKTANILLDDKHKAQVSDFGSSKTIEIDQTHLTTLVQGTFGYLDPEYFESGIFTDKSDVYSFGVVLLELLTSKKPIYRDVRMEQKVLVTDFFLHVQNSNLLDILDPEVVKEAKDEELAAMADLAMHCLNGIGRLRPTMKEVSMKLEMIIKSPSEMSIDSQQALPNKGLKEIFMPEMSGVGSPLYIDYHPLLYDTI